MVNGSFYIGEWKRDKANGKGKLTGVNEDYYSNCKIKKSKFI